MFSKTLPKSFADPKMHSKLEFPICRRDLHIIECSATFSFVLIVNVTVVKNVQKHLRKLCSAHDQIWTIQRFA